MRCSASGEAARDLDRFAALHREHAELSEVVAHWAMPGQADQDLETAGQMRDDPQMRAFAEEEQVAARARVAAEEAANERIAVAARSRRRAQRDPRDPRRHRRRRGALFAGDLLRMYLRYAERSGWQFELLSRASRPSWAAIGRSSFGSTARASSATSSSSAAATASSASRRPRPRAGSTPRPHGRRPARGRRGRRRRSRPEDLEIDVMRAAGAGRPAPEQDQSGVRITHLPTGSSSNARTIASQHKNKAKAMRVLRARLFDHGGGRPAQSGGGARKSLIGSGDRSQRIRTYNFPQGRVTDHRIDLTLYKLDQVIDGDLDEVTDALITAQIAEQMEALEDER